MEHECDGWWQGCDECLQVILEAYRDATNPDYAEERTNELPEDSSEHLDWLRYTMARDGHITTNQ